MLLYCIRHGESVYNAEGRIQGQADIPLSPLGRRQSRAVAELLVSRPIEAIFSSPLARAGETAAAIGEALGLPVEYDARLQEIHAGIFQGLAWNEIERSHPDEAARWLAQEPDFVIPGGESRRSLMDRGRAALEAIRATDRRQVVVVSHGGLLSAAFKALLEIPAQRTPFALYNASVSRVAWDQQFRLQTLNETAHLRAVTSETASAGDLAI